MLSSFSLSLSPFVRRATKVTLRQTRHEKLDTSPRTRSLGSALTTPITQTLNVTERRLTAETTTPFFYLYAETVHTQSDSCVCKWVGTFGKHREIRAIRLLVRMTAAPRSN